MARVDELIKMAKEYNLKMISIEDLIKYRRRTEINVKHDETIKLPTSFGEFELQTFKDLITKENYIVLTAGDFKKNPLVRVHSQCMTGDIFASQRCDCGEQLHLSMKMIQEKGGVIIYEPQEGRGIGILNKIKAYKLQEQGHDTIEANKQLGFHADLRDYSACAQILKALGINNIQLLTNNPNKVESLTDYGIQIKRRVPLEVAPNKNNQHYLNTKKNRMGHLFNENVIHLH